MTAIVFLVAATAMAADLSSYKAEVERWRAQREASLKADDGWLTVTGLFWLKEGPNSAGAGAANDIRLPRGPERLGVFELRGGKVTFHGADGRTLAMQTDKAGSPTPLTSGDLTMFVIERGRRYGIRLKDKQSQYRKEFHGLEWFAIDERYRVTARFVPYNPPKSIPVLNVLGDTTVQHSPGFAEFTLNGQSLRLEPVEEGDQLFFILKDRTAGKQTYPAGRFLYAARPKDGTVVLDFNKAYSPPCAFTPYATCPLPPKQNQLPVRIEAGEKNPHAAP